MNDPPGEDPKRPASSGRSPAAANTKVGQSGRSPAAANTKVGQSGRSPAAANTTVGLCASCGQARRIVSSKGSEFWLCELAESDKRFRKYPQLPVLRCAGYEPAER